MPADPIPLSAPMAPWAYLDALTPAPDAPASDNPSGTYCPECRAVGLYHCSEPEFCGGLRPMRPKESGHD